MGSANVTLQMPRQRAPANPHKSGASVGKSGAEFQIEQIGKANLIFLSQFCKIKIILPGVQFKNFSNLAVKF
jgi:hypothetical protein